MLTTRHDTAVIPGSTQYCAADQGQITMIPNNTPIMPDIEPHIAVEYMAEFVTR